MKDKSLLICISVVLIVGYLYVVVILSVLNTYTIDTRHLYLFRFARSVVNYFTWILLILSMVIMCVKVYNYLVGLKQTKTVIYLLHSSLIVVLFAILVTIPIGYHFIRPVILFWNVFWISILIELCEIMTAVVYLCSALLLQTVLMSLSFSIYKFKVVVKPEARPRQVMRPIPRHMVGPVVMGPNGRPVVIQRGATPVMIRPTINRYVRNQKSVVRNNKNLPQRYAKKRDNPQIVIMPA